MDGTTNVQRGNATTRRVLVSDLGLVLMWPCCYVNVVLCFLINQVLYLKIVIVIVIVIILSM